MPTSRTYDELYPDAADGDEILGGLFKVVTPRPCMNCGRLTRWVDMDFEAHMCSPHCDHTVWLEYCEALRS